MENFYLIIVIVLFFLAISDLVVGVSNDAVNFLNSAIGSKVAPFRVIMIIAGIGVLVGATFSSGMMEVARKGIFHPDMFVFDEIIIIFLAVMLTDVILLDLFNTMGLPTSTTVSIVFELLGASVGIAFIKVRQGLAEGHAVMDYINGDSALMIVVGILLSVFIAFTVGAIVQYVTRLLFTFNFQRNLKYFGALWGGLALAIIIYFIAIKGAKGASFMTENVSDWIKNNGGILFLIAFVFFTLLFQVLYAFVRINIPKIIVLVGTFSLAMAFAGNDLVNFIGVPLAGFESYKIFAAQQDVSATQFTMESLKEAVRTPTFFLLIAGLIMVITLWVSRKAQSVVRTSINLSRQEEGYERFETSKVARVLVRSTIFMGNVISRSIPPRVWDRINGRFNNMPAEAIKKEQGVAFDLIRASVNLVVASILIAFATSLKLPLSTTYVTFMVAMGTSLSDGAWNRESAVYRITGVVTVIGGWFMTAISAFTVAFVVASVIHLGGMIAVFSLIALAIFFVIRTHAIHLKREKTEKEAEKNYSQDDLSVTEKCYQHVISILLAISKLLNDSVEGLGKHKRKKLKKTLEASNELNKQVKIYKDRLYTTIKNLEKEGKKNPHYYVLVMDQLKELTSSFDFVIRPAYMHVSNDHTPIKSAQAENMMILAQQLSKFIDEMVDVLTKKEYQKISELAYQQDELLAYIGDIRKKQIKRLQKEKHHTKNNILYLDIVNETKNLTYRLYHLAEAMQDFEQDRDSEEKPAADAGLAPN
ncbi:MAG: phosphate permease [Bacteroidetes bacterium]|jgi:phosphate/sulfate permease|nr:phosphate permease [Bacteroidota bacterium]